MKDFYYILGTTANASPPEIDAAYRKLARKFRQTGEEDDEFIDARFRDIAEAYDTLRDARRRRKYDEAFKRNQKRQFAIFKLKYLNIAVTLTFLVVTALFAAYVIRTIRGHAIKKIAPKALAQPSVVAVTHPKKHHKLAISLVKGHPGAIDTLQHLPATQPALRPAPPADSTVMLHANITGIIYLHQEPDFNSPVLAKIPDGAEVKVLQKGTAYYQVLFNGQSGYVIRTSAERK